MLLFGITLLTLAHASSFGRLALCAPRAFRRLRGGADELLDEGLYSRQLYVLGHRAQRSLAVSSVLIVGLSGLGAEVAKNLVLAGISEVDVHDDAAVSLADVHSVLAANADRVLPKAVDMERPVAEYVVHVTNTGAVDADDVVLGLMKPPGAGVGGTPLQVAAHPCSLSYSTFGLIGTTFTELGI